MPTIATRARRRRSRLWTRIERSRATVAPPKTRPARPKRALEYTSGAKPWVSAYFVALKLTAQRTTAPARQSSARRPCAAGARVRRERVACASIALLVALLAARDEGDAPALVLELARRVEHLPAAVLALVLARRRPDDGPPGRIAEEARDSDPAVAAAEAPRGRHLAVALD